MSDEIPIEVLEAQRRIRAAQVQVVPHPPKPVSSITDALSALRDTIEKKPIIPNEKFDAAQRKQTVEQLQTAWNAPERHATRAEFLKVQQWDAQLTKLAGMLGAGITVALVGTRGPGKTQMAVELMRITTSRLRSAYYCTAMDYFMRIKDCFHPDRRESQADAQKFFTKPKLLVIDELNVRSDSPWEDNMLSDLIGKRYNAMLDTILISNETASAFEKSMGPSIIDRLNETGGVVECTWPSFRR